MSPSANERNHGVLSNISHHQNGIKYRMSRAAGRILCCWCVLKQTGDSNKKKLKVNGEHRLEEPLLKNVKPKNAVLPYKKDDLNYEEQLFSPSKEFQKQGTHETINSEQLREGDDYHPEVVAQTPPFITARADITIPPTITISPATALCKPNEHNTNIKEDKAMDMLVDSVPCSNYVNGISLQEVPPLNLTQLDEDDTKGEYSGALKQHSKTGIQILTAVPRAVYMYIVIIYIWMASAMGALIRWIL